MGRKRGLYIIGCVCMCVCVMRVSLSFSSDSSHCAVPECDCGRQLQLNVESSLSEQQKRCHDKKEQHTKEAGGQNRREEDQAERGVIISASHLFESTTE